jgi:alkylated DNA repair dioxygenase AlkB
MRARRTASFGRPYDYSGMTYPEAPWPDWLASLRERVSQAVGHPLNNGLANHYADGEATMGFHADNMVGLAAGSRVAIVSLGAERTLRFRHQRDRSVVVDQRLAPGSLLHMGADVQAEWHHAVPAAPGAGPRISLTFRQMG